MNSIICGWNIYIYWASLRMKQVELYVGITQLIYLTSSNLTYLVYKLSSTC